MRGLRCSGDLPFRSYGPSKITNNTEISLKTWKNVNFFNSGRLITPERKVARESATAHFLRILLSFRWPCQKISRKGPAVVKHASFFSFKFLANFSVAKTFKKRAPSREFHALSESLMSSFFRPGISGEKSKIHPVG